MALTILNNIAAIVAENQLNLTSASLNTTLQQLSSGSRINTGADDPAGLAIANGLEANIAALTQSVSNANDGVGQLQLADGALAQVTNLLNTAVTLATESATGTVSNTQRVAIQSQYASILAEINRIGTSTTYNSQAVFQGGVTTNLNAVESGNNGTADPLAALTPLTTGDSTSVSAGGVTFTYTATAGNAADPNTVTGSSTGLGGASTLGAGAVLTLTRASGTSTYTVTGTGATMAQLMAAINTGTVAAGVNITADGTDSSHANYTASLTPAGSLQITDLNGNNDLAATLTGQTTGSATQYATSGQNYSTATALAAAEVITIARAGETAIYTVGAGGSTLGQLMTAINTGQTQNNGAGQIVTITATGTPLATAGADLNAVISNGNLAITDSSGLGGFGVTETTGADVNTTVLGATVLTGTLNAGYTMTLTRGGKNTIYTVNAGGTATDQALLQAINTGVSTAGVGGITISGAGSAAGFSAYIDANNKLNVTDTTYSGALTGFQNGIYAPNEVATNSTASLNTATTILTTGEVVTLTRNAGTPGAVSITYTASAGAELADLITAIDTGTTVTPGAGGIVTVSNSAAAKNMGLTAAVVAVNGVSQLVVTDTTGGALTATDSALGALDNGASATTALGPAYTAMTGNGPGVFSNLDQQFQFAANANPAAGFFTASTTTPSTVQSLLNAINDNTTVGAKAALVAGVLQISDPLDRQDLQVTTTDPVLGAAVSGASTILANDTTTSTATDANELVGSTATTLASYLTSGSVTSFTAGGKTFSFTAGASSTVANLINAINSPSDTAGLNSYLNSSGFLVVNDPSNSNNLSEVSADQSLGGFTNPTITTSPATNIFLSDATTIGSSQIAVIIGGLSSTAITNGNGGNAINLAGTDLNTQGDAQTALTQINQAISNVASTRGTLGASVNRLTAASNVIDSQVQNLTSAENTITAADIPSTVASLTKYSILEQTGISALAQANQQQQLVLKLLQ